MRYKVVNRDELIAALGTQCSPDSNRKAYIIGPDANGRLCHVGSYRYRASAEAAAHRLNGQEEIAEGVRS